MGGTSETRASILTAYLSEANEEELVVGEAKGWESLLLPVLFQPVLIRLEVEERDGLRGGTDPTAACHSAPAPQPYPVGSLEPPIISDVLPEGVLAIDSLPIDGVVAVLLHHACCLPLEGLH